MFNRMGVPNGQMALFTSLLYLPWTLKPLWSPFVDILKTKRWWILSMQLLMTAAMLLLAFSIPHPDPATIAAQQTPVHLFTLTLVLFIITAFASATHDIAADGFYMLALPQKQQSFFVGIRSTFYRISSIFGQGVLVFVAGLLEHCGDIPAAWMITMGITAILLATLTLWHIFAVPRPKDDAPRPQSMANHYTAADMMREFGRAFTSFFRKPIVWIGIVFMLLYRLPEAFLLKMVNPFLLDPTDKGGLALPTETVGIVYGTIGIMALTLGGIAGGVYASKRGLRKSLWPMAACMTLPCLTFVYLSIVCPESLVVIGSCIAVEQFGYGFGFTAYMLFMMYISEGEFKTSHYALCTAFMALSMMIPGMFAGYLQEHLGYVHFFGMVIACCMATVAVTFVVMHKVDETYGRK